LALFSLYSGITTSLLVIFFNIRIIMLGLKEIDPFENMDNIIKIAFPASVFELLYLLWVFLVLPSEIVYLLLLVSLLGLYSKIKKRSGYKFAMFVLAPASEIIIVIYGLYLFNQMS